MDKVLTRKMFKTRYFKSLKPTIKHYQTGGLSSLTPKEKAIYAATLAGPLLQAKGSGVGNALSALGEGVSKLPATILAIEKNKADSGSGRYMTEKEVKDAGLLPGTVAYKEAGKAPKILQKPGEKRVETLANTITTRKLLGRIATSYDDLGKPVGFLDTGRIKGTIGKVTGSGYADEYQQLKQNISSAGIFLTKTISGAQVTDQERARIEELIPQVGDTEIMFEAKLKALDKYLNDVEEATKSGGLVSGAPIEDILAGGSASDYLEQFLNTPQDIKVISETEIDVR